MGEVERFEPRIHGGTPELIHHEGDEGKYVLFSDYQALQEELKEESQRTILWRKDCERLEEDLEAAEAKLEELKQEVDLWATRAEAAERELGEAEEEVQLWKKMWVERGEELRGKLAEVEGDAKTAWLTAKTEAQLFEEAKDERDALIAGVEAILNSDGGLEAMYEELTDLLDSSTEEPKGEE